MFLAQFQQVNSDKFEADKNGNLPFIGDIILGTATGSLINGTMFQRNGLEAYPQMYACENFIDDEYPDNIQTRVLGKVSYSEYNALTKEMSQGRLKLPTVANGDNVPAPEKKVAKV